MEERKLENSFFSPHEIYEIERTRLSENIRITLLNKLLSAEITVQNIVSQCDNLKSEIDEMTTYTRCITYSLITPDFHNLSFPQILKDYVYVLNLVNSSMEFVFKENSTMKWENLCTAKLVALYRIIQEAVRNCMQHSKAQKVRIVALLQETCLDISIKDDGKGFDSKAHFEDGFGLKIIENRANIIGASIIVLSKPNEGTELKISCPSPFME